MATTDNAAEKHYAITIFLYKKVFKTRIVPKGVKRLIEMGMIQTDRLYEAYEAMMMKTTIVSVAGMDLASGHDCKLRSLYCNYNKKTGYNQWMVMLNKDDLKNKTGSLLIGVINVLTGTFDRLEIPYSVYGKMKQLALTYSLRGKGYGKYEQYVISREAF
jgi:hypothetical protein